MWIIYLFTFLSARTADCVFFFSFVVDRVVEEVQEALDRQDPDYEPDVVGEYGVARVFFVRFFCFMLNRCWEVWVLFRYFDPFVLVLSENESMEEEEEEEEECGEESDDGE